MTDAAKAALVANVTEAIAALQQAIGVPDTRKLLLWLAKGLGAPETINPPDLPLVPDGETPE